MLKKIVAHFNKEELKSILLTFFSIAAIEALTAWNAIFSGDLSRETLIALGGALLKSLLKAIFLTEIKPKLETKTETITTTLPSAIAPETIPVDEINALKDGQDTSR